MSVKRVRRLVAGEKRTINGREVSIDVDELEHALPACEVSATCGETVIEQTVTLTPSDGGYGPMPDDHVERTIESAKGRAARAAAYREEVRAQLAAVQAGK